MRNYGCIFLLAVLLAGSLTTQSLAQQKAEPDFAPLFKALVKGKSVEMDNANAYYLYGVASKYRELCGWPYPDTKMDFERFITKIELRSTHHAHSRAPQDMFNAPIADGEAVQKGADTVRDHIAQKSCKPSKLSEGLEKLALGKRKKGELPVFISTCMERKMTQAQCACVGEVGETVIAGTMDMPYQDGVVTSWAERNPLLAFTLPSLCGL